VSCRRLPLPFVQLWPKLSNLYRSHASSELITPSLLLIAAISSKPSLPDPPSNSTDLHLRPLLIHPSSPTSLWISRETNSNEPSWTSTRLFETNSRREESRPAEFGERSMLDWNGVDLVVFWNRSAGPPRTRRPLNALRPKARRASRQRTINPRPCLPLLLTDSTILLSLPLLLPPFPTLLTLTDPLLQPPRSLLHRRMQLLPSTFSSSVLPSATSLEKQLPPSFDPSPSDLAQEIPFFSVSTIETTLRRSRGRTTTIQV